MRRQKLKGVAVDVREVAVRKVQLLQGWKLSSLNLIFPLWSQNFERIELDFVDSIFGETELLQSCQIAGESASQFDRRRVFIAAETQLSQVDEPLERFVDSGGQVQVVVIKFEDLQRAGDRFHDGSR